MSELISITQNTDFRRIYHRSEAYVNPALVVYYTKSRAGCCRLGITVSKKIGCAVKRNRAKRVIREAYKACVNDINGNYDFIIVARSKTGKLKSWQVADAFREILKNGGLLKQ